MASPNSKQLPFKVRRSNTTMAMQGSVAVVVAIGAGLISLDDELGFLRWVMLVVWALSLSLAILFWLPGVTIDRDKVTIGGQFISRSVPTSRVAHFEGNKNALEIPWSPAIVAVLVDGSKRTSGLISYDNSEVKQDISRLNHLLNELKAEA